MQEKHIRIPQVLSKSQPLDAEKFYQHQYANQLALDLRKVFQEGE